MSPKRGDRAAPPPTGDDWDIRFDNSKAANGWEDLSRQVPKNTAWAWWEMRTAPGPMPRTPRHHKLRGDLATDVHGGQLLPQWQIEVTGGGRIWYLLDEERHTVWITYAGTGHPSPTD